MTLSQIRRAYRLYAHEHADKATIRHNVLAYLKSVQTLGERYILAKPVQRLAIPRSH